MRILDKHFNNQSHGGVSVDWLFLTGGLLSLTMAVLAMLATGSSSFTDNTDSHIAVIEHESD